MNFELLKDLVINLERFSHENNAGNVSLKDFGIWITNQTVGDFESTNEMMKPASGLVPDDIKALGELPEVVIGKLLTYLSRYLKIYFKKGLEGSLLTTSDDFTYLAILLNKGNMTKTELILLNAHEKTSGMEVIKRLLNNGLIEQYDDKTDKRSKQVAMTGLGRTVLFQSFEAMGKVGKIGTGNLEEQEKQQLMNLLTKLDNFHNDIYLNHKEKDLNQLIQEKFL